MKGDLRLYRDSRDRGYMGFGISGLRFKAN